VIVFKATESNLKSAAFELAGPFQIGYGGQRAVPVKIELRSAAGSAISSMTLPAASGGLHCVGGSRADGAHRLVVVPQAPTTDGPASLEMMVAVFAS
jgi:hypothetical protein